MHTVALQGRIREDLREDVGIERYTVFIGKLPVERRHFENLFRLRNADQDNVGSPASHGGNHGVEIPYGSSFVLLAYHIVPAMTDYDEIRLLFLQDGAEPAAA